MSTAVFEVFAPGSCFRTPPSPLRPGTIDSLISPREDRVFEEKKSSPRGIINFAPGYQFCRAYPPGVVVFFPTLFSRIWLYAKQYMHDDGKNRAQKVTSSIFCALHTIANSKLAVCVWTIISISHRHFNFPPRLYHVNKRKLIPPGISTSPRGM